jgi:hypothetical protein
MTDQEFYMVKNRAITAYIKENFRPVKCHICGTANGVGYDQLADDNYCMPCLEIELRSDTAAWLECVSEEDAKLLASNGRI